MDVAKGMCAQHMLSEIAGTVAMGKHTGSAKAKIKLWLVVVYRCVNRQGVVASPSLQLVSERVVICNGGAFRCHCLC